MSRLYLVVLAGLIIRLALVPTPGFKIDVDAWIGWASRVYELGFSNFYSDTVWTNYTPGYIYILYALEAVKRFFNLSPEIFHTLVKIPSILAELALAAFVFKIVKERFSILVSITAASLILFNPAFIFNSSVWGQTDGILSLFMVLSIYYLTKSQPVLSSITFALALLIKPQALFLVPVYIFYILKNFNLNNIFRLAIPGIFLALTASLPFFPNKPLTGLFELIIKMANDYSTTSLFAYNFWGIIGFWIDDSNLWSGISYQTWGYILFAIYWIIISYFYFTKKLSIYCIATLATLSFFFLLSRVHERYLYPAIIFLIICAFSIKSKLLIILTAVLSFIHFLNLYYVYIYYNEFYLKLPKTFYQPILSNLLDANGKLFSIVSTALFILISIIIIKSQYANKKS